MDRLSNVDVEELRRWFDEVEQKESTLRLMAAIGYKRGLDVDEIAEWYGISADDIDDWFDEFEAKPLPQMIDEVERFSRERAPPFIPRIRARVEYLNYEVLDDLGWDVEDEDLFDRAHDANLDSADFGGFVVNPGETILEAAENRGYSWPYACRGGACANCAVILKSGEIAMPGDHILPDDAVDDGVRLTCVGVPLTEEVQIVYNAKHEPELDDLRLPPGPFLAGVRGR
ncbi:MAG TPA: ferredoxin Fer [Halobacteriales archaeon]|nr:ferredoxin Fer [Halobacteriales archaeon]